MAAMLCRHTGQDSVSAVVAVVDFGRGREAMKAARAPDLRSA